ncbi:MAG: sigma-70 family RNA polymerase sigma factor [Deltaproteobacteria bacterium]|nr:sigma-70 family RNA polymerase sigma factor [Deltaproteobacteria bacterium]MBW2417196.1 sigma-70 family RNA polymerase sigma factor [Deltaproteobacteria bacterium]
MGDESQRAGDAQPETLSEERAAPGSKADDLIESVYAELRRLAASYLQQERSGHTLQATALVHEAYARLVDQSRAEWKSRTHFFAVGAKMMRRILIDHARERRSQKRGGEQQRVTLSAAGEMPGGGDLDYEELLSIDEALHRLAELDERQAKVVELRFFAGMSVAEVAEFLDVSPRTVEGDWTHARTWLRRELSERNGA